MLGLVIDEYDVPALGMVVDQDRGSLPYSLIHGESLIACAAWGLGDAGVTPIDFSTAWAGVVDAGEPFVVHDTLCPMTPASFIASCLATAVSSDTVVVAFRPVTDTVKQVVDGFVGATVDRSTLRQVASPIVLPASVVLALESLPTWDFTALVAALDDRFPITWVEAPPSARRVASLDDVRLLEALTGGR
jgi:2-C-methyl-D-erythritol 4-phosphate cytidylyltransferase